MSLRRFRQILFLAALAAAAGGGRLLLDRLPSFLEQHRVSNNDRLVSTSNAITYRIDGKKWIRFSLPPELESLRCLFNANVPGQGIESGDEWNFQIGWRWLDSRGRTMREGTYYLSTRVSIYRGDSGEGVVSQFYERDNKQPADGRRLVLSPTEKQPVFLALRLMAAQSPIESVAARVSVLVPVQDEERRGAWQRLPRRERRQLALNNALASLTDEEKQNLIRNRYRPIGPTGIEGRDYISQRLYSRSEPGIAIEGHEPGNEKIEGLRLKVWPSGLGKVLEWAIAGDGQQPTPFRLDLRNLEPVRVNYQALDGNGREIVAGALFPRSGLSADESLDGGPVSEPSHTYFSLPAEVTSLRLTSDALVWCSAWLRPPGLARRKTQAALAEKDSWLPAWFSLRPDKGGQAHTLIQKSVPEEPILEEYQTSVHEMEPEGNWMGRFVLLTRELETLPDNAPLTTVYTPLRANRKSISTFEQAQVHPTLVFQRKSGKVTKLQVEIDGQLGVSQTVSARGGELALGELAAGTHSIRVFSRDKGLALFLNHRRPEAQFQRRKLAPSLGEEPLVYHFEKKGRGRFTLSARLLGKAGEQFVLVARLQGPGREGHGPFDRYSFTHQELSIELGEKRTVRVPAGRKQWLSESRPWFLHMEDDLMPGMYRLHIEKKSGGRAFVLLSHLEHEQPETVPEAAMRTMTPPTGGS